MTYTAGQAEQARRERHIVTLIAIGHELPAHDADEERRLHGVRERFARLGDAIGVQMLDELIEIDRRENRRYHAELEPIGRDLAPVVSFVDYARQRADESERRAERRRQQKARERGTNQSA